MSTNWPAGTPPKKQSATGYLGAPPSGQKQDIAADNDRNRRHIHRHYVVGDLLEGKCDPAQQSRHKIDRKHPKARRWIAGIAQNVDDQHLGAGDDQDHTEVHVDPTLGE